MPWLIILPWQSRTLKKPNETPQGSWRDKLSREGTIIVLNFAKNLTYYYAGSCHPAISVVLLWGMNERGGGERERDEMKQGKTTSRQTGKQRPLLMDQSERDTEQWMFSEQLLWSTSQTHANPNDCLLNAAKESIEQLWKNQQKARKSVMWVD